MLTIGKELTIKIGNWDYKIKKKSSRFGTQTNWTTLRVGNIARKNGKYIGNNVYDDFDFNQQLYVLNINELNDVDTYLIKQVRVEFWNSMSYSAKNIIKIQKCQHSDLLYQAYNSIVANKCHEYNEKAEKLEKFLWHGTSYDNVSQIIKTGFDRSFCKTYGYGKVCLQCIYFFCFLFFFGMYCCHCVVLIVREYILQHVHQQVMDMLNGTIIINICCIVKYL